MSDEVKRPASDEDLDRVSGGMSTHPQPPTEDPPGRHTRAGDPIAPHRPPEQN